MKKKLSLDVSCWNRGSGTKSPLYSQIKTKTERMKATKSASHSRYDSARKRKNCNFVSDGSRHESLFTAPTAAAEAGEFMMPDRRRAR
jgi:hypothetical protein